MDSARTCIEIVEADPGGEDARGCLANYYAELAVRFPAGFDVTRSRDPPAAALKRPLGCFLVACAADQPIGCVALRGTGGAVAEVKRFWVHPAIRGHGVASQLLRRLETIAVELGVESLRLDTHAALGEVRALYERQGWNPIERFNDDPYANFSYEKRLSPGGRPAGQR